MAHSLWLMPAARHEPLLRDWIETCCAAFDVRPFDPHITVAGRLGEGDPPDLRKLPDTAAITLTFGVPDFRPEWNMAVILPAVGMEPDDGLVALRKAALAALRLPHGEPYSPHLSLLYGSQATKPEKERAVAAIPSLCRRVEPFTFDRLVLMQTGGERYWKWRQVGQAVPLAVAQPR